VKAVCIIGSPRATGSTSAIVSEIFRALEAYGFETRLHRLSELDIGYCWGCKVCETTGKCVQNDDVQRIVDDMLDSELVIVASPSYWGDITGQLKVFIDRCTPFGNTNPARRRKPLSARGVAVAVRAGNSRAENLNLVNTIEHFLGHLDIQLASSFTVEGISSEADLLQRVEVLSDAYAFGKSLCKNV